MNSRRGHRPRLQPKDVVLSRNLILKTRRNAIELNVLRCEDARPVGASAVGIFPNRADLKSVLIVSISVLAATLAKWFPRKM